MLIDSHVLLWLAADDPSLGKQSREAIVAAERVWVSSISMLELEIKRMNGRLSMPDDFIRTAFELLRVVELTFTSDHASALSSFPELISHDPFDRALLAQALSEGLDFLTADRRLLRLDRSWIHDAHD